MGIYLYSIGTKAIGMMDGLPVYPTKFSRKISFNIAGMKADEEAIARIEGRHQRAGLRNTTVLVFWNGAIYRRQYNTGWFYDDKAPGELAGSRVKMKGKWVYVSAEAEATMWTQIGAWWRSSRQALRECSPHYRPTIRLDLSVGPMLVALYNATAEAMGDSRRAYATL